MPAKLYSPLANGSMTSGITPSLSTNYTKDTDFELASWDGRSSAASLNNVYTESDPPAYDEGVRFTPTVKLQIQTLGKAALSLPIPVRPDPIPVFAVDSDGTTLDAQAPVYCSLRLTRGSSSCFLVAGDGAQQRRLSTTTYRFGPGRPPRISLMPATSEAPGQGAAGGSGASAGGSGGEEEEEGEEVAVEAPAWDSFALTACGVLTRAIRFRTRLGTFEWRYASRGERKAAGVVGSLLVLDRVVRVFNSATSPGAKAKEEEIRTPVAQFLRTDELRSPGSRGSSAGNGGRLLVDTGLWQDGKEDAEVACVMAVTTCISMLKKEIDRRRKQQMAIMAAVIGAGAA